MDACGHGLLNGRRTRYELRICCTSRPPAGPGPRDDVVVHPVVAATFSLVGPASDAVGDTVLDEPSPKRERHRADDVADDDTY